MIAKPRPNARKSKLTKRSSTPPTKRVSEEKWGSDVMGLGYAILPSLLFQAQKRLGLSGMQLAVLIQLADFWWQPDNKPHPGKQRLANRLGVTERTIQRNIAALEQAGYVERKARYGQSGGRKTNIYDLSGLVRKLKELAPEFKEAKEEEFESRRRVERRGGK